jgi:hypothetical protein
VVREIMKKTLLVYLSFVGALGCVGPSESTAPESTSSEPVDTVSQPIIGGTADVGDPAIVLVFVQNTTQGAGCSATVVSPHVLLTAAHCLDPAVVDATVAEPHTYYVFLGDDINSASEANDPQNFVMVEKTVFDPLFSFQPGFATQPSHDIGVVITATALTMPPLPMNRTPLGPEWVGQPVRVVGYGLSTPGDINTSETKRMGMTTFAGIDAEYDWQDAMIPHTCEGDSGGPTLIMRNGIESVAGVHSWIQHAMSCTGDAYDMRADVDAVPFVDPFIAQYDPGFVVPSDASSNSGGSGGGGGSGGAGEGKGTTTGTGGATHPKPSESSGCSMSPSSGSGTAASALVLAALGISRARRRVRRRSRSAQR